MKSTPPLDLRGGDLGDKSSCHGLLTVFGALLYPFDFIPALCYAISKEAKTL